MDASRAAPSRARTRLVAAAVVFGAVVVAAVLWAVVRWAAAPRADPALADAATRAIDAYFEQGPGLLTSGRLRLDGPGTARWFCTVDLVEVRQRVRGRAVAGVLASCGEFASVGGRLLEGTAFANVPMRVTMAVTDGRLSVRQVERVADGAGFAPGVERLFSEAGAREVLRRQGAGAPSPSPLDQARQAFGLPPSARPQRR